MRIDDERLPTLLTGTNLFAAVLVHGLVFAVGTLFSLSFDHPPKTPPIEMTVVVVENLDGNDDEPPPLAKPEPVQPKPVPKRAEPKPAPPKVADPKIEAAETVKDKKKKPPKKEAKPEKNVKTKEQLAKEREERFRRMRQSTTKEKTRPTTNGRTAKKTLTDAEIQKWLNLGATAGRVTQLPASEEQRCHSLIYRAYYSKWERPNYQRGLRRMVLRVQFGAGGRVLGWKLTESSGNARADASVRAAASAVTSVPGLSADFIAADRGFVNIVFEVTD